MLEHWDTQEHVREAVPDGYWDWQVMLQEEMDWRELFIAEVDRRPIGFVQIIDPYHEETHYWGKIEEGKRAIDIWIGEKDYLNRGLGTQMMEQALDRCFQDISVNEVLLDPMEENIAAIRFYERLGFRYTEHRAFLDTVGPVYRLSRSTWTSGA